MQVVRKVRGQAIKIKYYNGAKRFLDGRVNVEDVK